MTSTPASERPLGLVDYWTPLLVRLFVEHGVFEAFGREARTVEDVAAETGTHPGAVSRIVRALRSRGVFERAGGDRVRLTDAGRLLLHDEPGTLAGLANFKSYELHAWAEAPHTLRTGEPSFPAFFGQDMWTWLESNPDAAGQFNDTMRRRTASLLNVALDRFDWPHSGTVVDVGGGNGLLLERLLTHRPELRGVVFDLPHVVDEARRRFATSALADRVDVVGGDFFGTIPSGHDVYVMASVLHDWNDDDAARILDSVRRAIPATGRLVLFESVLTDDDEPDLGKMVDLHMMVLLGAQERTRAEWEALLAVAGFEVTTVVPTPALSWVEARPSLPQ